MKVTELINHLQDILEKYGDYNVLIETEIPCKSEEFDSLCISVPSKEVLILQKRKEMGTKYDRMEIKE